MSAGNFDVIKKAAEIGKKKSKGIRKILKSF